MIKAHSNELEGGFKEVGHLPFLAYYYIFIHLVLFCRSDGQRLSSGKINFFVMCDFFPDELDSYCCKNLLVD